MKRFLNLAVIVGFLVPVCAAFAQQSRPLPIYPQANQVERHNTTGAQRAYQLYELARSENRRLKWDSCLSAKAVLRARRMVSRGYFDHEDPGTGRNPVWNSVSQCVPGNMRRTRVPAGENLTKGVDTPANIHKALMSSPTHRKNILDPRFDRMGVGCYDTICVELFMGL